MQEFAICITGFIFMLLGIITLLESDQPKRRFGYHLITMKHTPEAWKLSNKFASKLWLIFGAIALAIGVLFNSYFRLLTIGEIILVNILEIIIIIGVTTFLTELSLRLKFDKEGKRK